MDGRFFDRIESEDYGEALDYEGISDLEAAGESDFGEADYGEAARSPYQQRVQEARRRKELERRRREMARYKGRPTTYPYPGAIRPTPTVQVTQELQRTQAGIAKVDLENQVQTDLIGNTLRKQSSRITGTEYSLAASTLIEELKEEFPDVFQGELGSLLPFTSLLFVKPEDKGKTGLERYINDPRFLFPAIALAIKLFRQNRAQAQRITMTPASATLGTTTHRSTTLFVFDDSGAIVSSSKITWTSADTNIATVDPSGKVTAVNTGDTVILATVDLNGATLHNQVFITVEDS